MASAVTNVALIVNPRSHSNRGAVLSDQHRALRGQFLSARPETRQELSDTLRHYADRDVRVIVIDGGDGTVREVLSVLPDAYGDKDLPDVVIVPSGHANVVAADVGTPGRGEKALRRIMSAIEGDAPPLRQTTRPLIEIRRHGDCGQVLRGFFFGAAAFAHATEQVHRSRRYNRFVGAPAVGAFLAASFLRGLLPGRHRSLWLAGEAMTVSVDGRTLPQAPQHFLLLGTTLHRLVLGLWPFWGGTRGDGLHWLDIDAPPKRLLRAARRVAYGQPEPWMAAAGYRSGTAGSLSIRLAAPFVLDGELFDPGPDGIDVSVGPSIRFLAP